MRSYKLISLTAGVLAVICAVVTIWFAVSSVSSVPVLIGTPESAQSQTEDLMEAVCAGQFDRVSTLLKGSPDLGMGPAQEDTAEALLWQAWLESLHYEFTGACYVTREGLARDVDVWGMDVEAATQAVIAEVELLLPERLAEAQAIPGTYDADGDVSEAFVAQVVRDAAAKVLERQLPEKNWTLTLSLEYAGDRWTVIPDARLQGLLSGQLR